MKKIKNAAAKTGLVFFSGATFYCYTGSTGASIMRFNLSTP